MTPVTDPKLLAQLNSPSGGMKPVTDPALLAQLNASPSTESAETTMDVQMPDGTTIQGVPVGTTKADLMARYQRYMKQQPTLMQKVIASPAGRLVHDAMIAPIEGISSLLAKADPTMIGAGMDKIVASSERPYQDAIAAARNTPGYAAAREAADKARAAAPSGLSDQFLAPFMPAMAGTFGGILGMSLDSSNAAADAQTEAQDAYAKEHPYASVAANLAGGLLAGPEAVTAAAARPVLATGASPTVATKAADYVSGLMRSAGKDPAALVATQTGGKPIMAADAIGKPGVTGLGALARRNGKTADLVTGLTAARDAAAPERILSDYATAAGIDPRAASGDLKAFVDANQGKSGPLYQDAYAANQNIASPVIDQILATPAGRQAMRDASAMMQNDRTLMGVRDPDLLEQAREAGQEIPWQGGVASGLKLRSLDYVKRALDDQIGAAYRAGQNTHGGILTGLKNDLLKELDAADVTAKAGPNSLKPGGGKYAQARAAAGDYLGAQEQFDNGAKFILSDKVSAADMKAHLADLGASDAQAFKGGVANRLFNVAQSGKLGPQVFKAPIVQEKLATVMGESQAKTFLAQIQREAELAGNSRFMRPFNNSPTANFKAAMEEQDGAAGVNGLALDLAQNVASSGPGSGIVKTILQRGVHQPLAALRTRGMSIPVRDEAGRLLTMSPQDLGAYLQQPGLLSRQQAPMLNLPAPAPLGLLGSGLEAFSQRERR